MKTKPCRGIYRWRAAAAALCISFGCMHGVSAQGDTLAVDGDWIMAAHDYASTRYSPLSEITPANAGQLKLAWSFSTSIDKGHEAAPIVVGCDHVRGHAVPESRHRIRPGEARREREVDVRSQDAMRRRRVSRAAMSSTAALPTATDGFSSTRSTIRRSRWMPRPARSCGARSLGDIAMGQTITMAPLFVKGKVLVGNSGGELGVRGWLTALDASHRKADLARVQHRARQGRAHRRSVQTVLRGRSRAPTSASPRGRRKHGRSAAARCGGGSRTTRSSISSITVPATRDHGIPSSARAPTSGRAASSRAGPITATRSGSTRPARTTCTTTTA